MNCNDTITFWKEMKRMCNSKKDCVECPVNEYCTGECTPVDVNYFIEIVQKWSDEHPQKTYKEDFLSKFPRAKIFSPGGSTIICRKDVYGLRCFSSETYKCEDCWNKLMREET